MKKKPKPHPRRYNFMLNSRPKWKQSQSEPCSPALCLLWNPVHWLVSHVQLKCHYSQVLLLIVQIKDFLRTVLADIGVICSTNSQVIQGDQQRWCSVHPDYGSLQFGGLFAVSNPWPTRQTSVSWSLCLCVSSGIFTDAPQLSCNVHSNSGWKRGIKNNGLK